MIGGPNLFIFSPQGSSAPTAVVTSATPTSTHASTASAKPTTTNVPDIVSHTQNEAAAAAAASAMDEGSNSQDKPLRPPRRKKKSSISQVGDRGPTNPFFALILPPPVRRYLQSSFTYTRNLVVFFPIPAMYVLPATLRQGEPACQPACTSFPVSPRLRT